MDFGRSPLFRGRTFLSWTDSWTLGQVVVVDRADIGLVHPRAEGDGGHHDGVVRRHEPLLYRAAYLVLEARMVGAGGETGGGQPPRHRFGGPLQGDVDDGGTLWLLPDAVQQDLIPFAGPPGQPNESIFILTNMGNGGVSGVQQSPF